MDGEGTCIPTLMERECCFAEKISPRRKGEVDMGRARERDSLAELAM